jgi:NAD-specific glutamate dehydrogenase
MLSIYIVLKTNFYTPTKVALSFRLDASFLPTEEYPQAVRAARMP